MSSRKKAIPANLDRKTLSPSFHDGEGFTPDQVLAAAEHILAIPGWVPVDRVMEVAVELLDLAQDEEPVTLIHKDGTEEERPGDPAQAGVYARAAARLIDTYELMLAVRP